MKSLLLTLTLTLIFSSCQAKQKSPKETLVLIETTMGNIKVKLYNETPLHRDNFIKLIKDKYYDGQLFHRVIKNFMIQTGDPLSKEAKADQMLGTGGPDYTIPAEILYPKYFHKRGALSAARQGDQINPKRESSGSQFYIVWGDTIPKQQLDQLEGMVRQEQVGKYFYAMADAHKEEIQRLQKEQNKEALYDLQERLINQAQKRAASDTIPTLSPEQKSIYNTLGGAPHLDNQYTVFGEVISGLEIVGQIQAVETQTGDRPKQDIRIKSIRIVKK